MTMARCAVILIVLMARATCAANFSAGVDAYAKGDYEDAFEEWQELARQGDSRAQYRLAQMFDEGIWVREDDQTALQWYQQAAEQGSIVARYELALMYLLGRGVRQDHSQSAHWYKGLAEDGYATAQYLLGGMYEDGTGVAKDVPRAILWYRRAGEQGSIGAQARLGEMYLQGNGVAKDLVQAWVWFELAATTGHEDAATKRMKVRRDLSEDEHAQAMKLARALSPPHIAQPVESELDPARAPEMVRIESGCFAMGSNPSEAGRHDNEPSHAACVGNFSIARHEVTRGQYDAFVSETGRETPNGCQTYGDRGWGSRFGSNWRDPGYAQNDDHPVACVSRDDALAYARWLSERQGQSYRLPTEAEWEYAARGGSGAARHWGNDAGQACLWGNVGDHALQHHYREWSWTIHACSDGYIHTAPVGSYRANPYALHDMIGNLWEWTCSGYDAAYRGAEHRCTWDDLNGVARGGSWSNSPRWARSAGRFENPVDARFDLVGFRLAHD